MPAGRWVVERLIDDVALLGRRALPREQYFGEVAARLRRVIDCDATCSLYTVQDHCLPQLAQRTPLTSSGGFARQRDP